jgi:hypothetical protein
VGRKEFFVAIESKELVQSPRFEGLGSFVYCRPGNDEWKPSYTLEFFGGQLSVEVEDSEVSNPPAVGTMFLIGGNIRHNSRNGSVSLVTSSKKLVAASQDTLSPEQLELYVRGLRIWGVGIVHAKESVVMNRQTYSKTTLKWQGATHEFRKLPPEVYQRIPSVGKYVRFELGLSVKEERNQTGQSVLVQFPSLASIKQDDFALGSVGASSSGGTVPPKPNPTAQPAAAKA